jgi:hypothetical protein
MDDSLPIRSTAIHSQQAFFWNPHMMCISSFSMTLSYAGSIITGFFSILLYSFKNSNVCLPTMIHRPKPKLSKYIANARSLSLSLYLDTPPCASIHSSFNYNAFPLGFCNTRILIIYSLLIMLIY